MALGIGGKKAHYTESPGENPGHAPSSQHAFAHSPVTFNLTPGLRNHNPHFPNPFLFPLHEIALVLSVFHFSPLCLQEHPISFMALNGTSWHLMALNKYIFWDLTEQAVLFQTASKASCLDS